MMTACTIRDLARASGLSIGTVSNAIRGHPSVAAETVRRVRALTDQMGYCPDTRLTSLMARIRRSRSRSSREVIAWVWVCTDKFSTYSSSASCFLHTVYDSARRRAEESGCILEPFWLDHNGMTAKRLEKILRTRGITGVLFSPAMEAFSVKLDWDWDAFAAVIVGMTDWKPSLHRVGHDYYDSVLAALEHAAADGYSSPAMLIQKGVHQRIHGRQQAAFQIHQPVQGMSESLIQFAGKEDRTDIKEWPENNQPDCLIVGWPVGADEAARLYGLYPSVRQIYTLDWWQGGYAPGVNVRFDVIAASAVDLLLAQLHASERGIPSIPRSVLIGGEWKKPVVENGIIPDCYCNEAKVSRRAASVHCLSI